MKYLILITGLITLTSQAVNAQEYKIYSPGNDSCGLFTQTINTADSPRKANYLKWIDSILNQANTIAASKPASGKADLKQGLEAIKQYCSSQSDASIAQATKAYLESAGVNINGSALDNGNFYGAE